MTTQETLDYLDNFTDEQLIDITEQLNNQVFPEDSLIRIIAKKIFGTDTAISITFIGVPLSQILAKRLQVSKKYSNRIVG